MTDEDRLRRSREAYAERAHAARIEQGLPEFIEDPATLNFLAETLSRAPQPEAVTTLTATAIIATSDDTPT